MNLSQFNLTATAAQIVRTSDTADIETNVKLLLAEIPEHEYPRVLEQLLPHAITSAQSNWRRSIHRPRKNRPPRDPQAAAGVWREEAQAQWRGYPLHLGRRSVTLAEATADDLRAAAEIRYANARGNQAWASKFTQLADALDQSGHAVLGELDDTTVLTIWEGAAA